MPSSPSKSRRRQQRERAESFKQAPEEVGVADMVLIPSLSNKGIVSNLRGRLVSDLIYTYIGNVLVVMNPYKWLKIYDKDTMRRYVHRNRVDVPPHIFATAEAAFRTMISEEESQCCIISGESGAGKVRRCEERSDDALVILPGHESASVMNNSSFATRLARRRRFTGYR